MTLRQESGYYPLMVETIETERLDTEVLRLVSCYLLLSTGLVPHFVEDYTINSQSSKIKGLKIERRITSINRKKLSVSQLKILISYERIITIKPNSSLIHESLSENIRLLRNKR